MDFEDVKKRFEKLKKEALEDDNIIRILKQESKECIDGEE